MRVNTDVSSTARTEGFTAVRRTRVGHEMAAKLGSLVFLALGLLILFAPMPWWPANIIMLPTLERGLMALVVFILCAIGTPPKWWGNYVIGASLAIVGMLFITIGLTMIGSVVGMAYILNGIAILANAAYAVFKARGWAR